MRGRTVARVLVGLCAAAAIAGSAPALAQTSQTRQVMREKLVRSSQLLAALVTSNWAALDRESRALEAVTARPGWDVLRSPEYGKQTSAFQLSVQALEEAAGRRDQREALSAYNALIASCVECHRFVARARVASLSGPAGPAAR